MLWNGENVVIIYKYNTLYRVLGEEYFFELVEADADIVVMESLFLYIFRLSYI